MPKILVVDDTASMRFLLRSMLVREGYEVSETMNGEECLRICAKSCPDLVILDMMMPGLSGQAVTIELRKQWGQGDLPIIMVTSMQENEALPDALRAGVNDFITKPVNREIFLARVKNQIEMRMQRKALVRAGELQRAVGESIPQGLLIHDSLGSVVYRNDALQSTFSANSEAAGLREVLSSMLGGALASRCDEILALIAIDPKREVEEEVESAVSGIRHTQIHSKLVRTSGGDPLRMWIFRDCTAAKMAERRANDLLRLETVSQFVGGVAHNFNNILGAVSGAVEMLSRGVGDDPKLTRLASLVHKGVSAAAEFTHRMSLFSQYNIETDLMPLQDLAALVEGMVLGMQGATEGRIQFSYSIEPNLPQVRMHISHVAEIFLNLISNAVDAIPTNGRITVTVRATATRNAVIATVQDTGSGMDSATLSRIFEPFFSTKNLDTNHSVSFAGNGLGLWNVYNLLQLTGGDIKIDSSPGVGTTVTLHFPVPNTETKSPPSHISPELPSERVRHSID